MSCTKDFPESEEGMLTQTFPETLLLTKHEQIMAECWDRLKYPSPPELAIYSQHKLRTLTFFSSSNTCTNCCVAYVKIWATAANRLMYGRFV